MQRELESRQQETMKENDYNEDDDDETPKGKPSNIQYQQHGNNERSIEESWTHGVSQQSTLNQNVAVAAPMKCPPTLPAAKLPPTNTRPTIPRYERVPREFVSPAIPQMRLAIPSSGYLEPFPTIHNIAEIVNSIKQTTLGQICAVPGADVKTETEMPR
jgi:hypothetical protein